MAGKGRRFTFHGAFRTHARALGKKHKIGGFIRRVTIKGRVRWVVLTRRK